MWRPFVALIVQGLLLVDGATANAVVSTPGAAAGAIVVTTPSQLQEAVRSGQRHVIINDHLDLTKSPKFSETTALDTSVLAVVQTGSGHFTQSIQGNCSAPAPGQAERALDPPPKFQQCVLTVREDFLEATLHGSHLWLSNLYVTIGAAPRNHSALVAALGPDVYMTDMAFVADGSNARALDVGGGRRVFISHSHFSGFDNTGDSAIRLEPGARATVTASVFERNTAARGGGSASGSGPIMGLHTGVSGIGAAAWFDDCLFRGNVAPSPGEVAVGDRACRVYSNTRLPTVWDRALRREVASWQLVPLQTQQSPQEQVDVFAVVADEGGAFLRPTDSFLLDAREETKALTQQSRLTAMTRGNEYTARDPYLTASGGALVATDDDASGASGGGSRRAIIIAGVCFGALIVAAAALGLAAICVKRHRLWPSSSGTLGSEAPPKSSEAVSKATPTSPPIASSTPQTHPSTAGSRPPRRQPPGGQQPLRQQPPRAAKPPPQGSRLPHPHGSTLRLQSGGPPSTLVGMHSPPSRRPTADLLPSYSTLPSTGATAATATPMVSSFGPSVAATTPPQSQQPPVCTADAFTESAALSTTPREPPGPGATTRERLEFLHYQLDTLAGRDVLGSLMLEPGPAERMHGGQAVIQFAKDSHSGRRCALKFFLSSAAFAGEAALYTDAHTPLGRFLPRLYGIAGAVGHGAPITDAHGRPLPPCIVMERGESLDVWLQRNDHGVDMVTGLQVIQHVAERLSDLHQAGYVHRDLKQSNVMWLPRENRWTLIDFGCAARIGEAAPLTASLKYAPPEVVLALQQEARTVRATAAMDAWALGVIAVELLSQRRVLEALEGRERVMAQIVGREPLPWEAGAEGAAELLARLGRFRGAVLGLLQRDPLQRLDAASFGRRCRAVLEQTRASEVSSAALPARTARTAPPRSDRAAAAHSRR